MSIISKLFARKKSTWLKISEKDKQDMELTEGDVVAYENIINFVAKTGKSAIWNGKTGEIEEILDE
jgi:hypothetical protein